MEPSRHWPHSFAEPSLDVHVNVFEGRVEGELAGLDLAGNLLEARDQGICVLAGNQPGSAKHLCVGDGAADVVARQGLVEMDRSAEPLHGRVGGALESPAPEFRGSSGMGIGFFGHGDYPRCG